MSNFFIELNKELSEGKEISEKDLVSKLEGKDFNSQLRDALEEADLSNQNILKIIRTYFKSHETEILLLLSLLYTKIKNVEKAFECALIAYTEEPKSQTEIIYINASFEKISEHLRKSDFEKADELIEEIHKKFKDTNSSLTNHFFLLQKIIPAYKMIDDKVSEVNKSIESQQWKAIEIVGLFSSIIAFIITNIQILTNNLKTVQVFSLMIGMACVLLIFLIAISYLFSSAINNKNEKDKLFSMPKDKRFLALALSLLVLLFLSFININ